MQNSSVALTLELAADTARLADETGSGVASTAATALVEIIGQVILYLSCGGDRFCLRRLASVYISAYHFLRKICFVTDKGMPCGAMNASVLLLCLGSFW